MTESMNSKPTISVVICTYNNADSLAITLQQISNQIVKFANSIEVVVVNNNSTDQTAQVCAAAADHIQLPFYYVFEAKQGLSHARNTGVATANADYILFTDDDAELPLNWAEAYLAKIAEHQPDCLYSRIHVIWDQPKPWWYQDEYGPCFVELNYGNSLLKINDIHHEFFGKNFCVKKQFILDQGGFDPALGRMGSKLIAGEETLLYRNLIKLGHKVIYFPDAPVGHRLKPKEYTEEHISKLFVDGAFSALHIAKISANKTLAGRPIGLFIDSIKNLFKSFVLYVKFFITNNKPQKFYRLLCIKKSLVTLRLWAQKA